MDDRRFDSLARALSAAPSRRGLLAALAAALGVAGEDAAGAKPEEQGKQGGRKGGKAHGRNRGNGHGNGRNRKGKRCDPKPDSEVCDGKCGPRKNNCGKRVECEPCPECLDDAGCGDGQYCDGDACADQKGYAAACGRDGECASGRCVDDAAGDGFCGCASAADCAGSAGAFCLGNGTCIASCTPFPDAVCPLPGCDGCGIADETGNDLVCRANGETCLPATAGCASSADCPFGAVCITVGRDGCCPNPGNCAVCVQQVAACIA